MKHDGGCARGLAPLRGEPVARQCQRSLLARVVPSGVGGTRPPQLSPEGKRERGDTGFESIGVTDYRCS
jgi:hypothetical protein